MLNALAIHALPHRNVPSIALGCAALVVARLRAIARVLVEGVHRGLPSADLDAQCRSVEHFALRERSVLSMRAKEGRHALAGPQRRRWKQTSDSE